MRINGWRKRKEKKIRIYEFMRKSCVYEPASLRLDVSIHPIAFAFLTTIKCSKMCNKACRITQLYNKRLSIYRKMKCIIVGALQVIFLHFIELKHTLPSHIVVLSCRLLLLLSRSVVYIYWNFITIINGHNKLQVHFHLRTCTF